MCCNKIQNEQGVGVAELLVGVFIFSIIILAISSFANLTFTNLGLENRASASSRELRNALALMSSELRMGSSVSPYLPGDDPAIINCLSQISTSSTSIRFLVIHDDISATSGIQPYYVGYSYDATKKQLLRGEIPGISITNCALPPGDPLSSAYARVVADRVYTYDNNGDGADESVFSYANGTLNVNLAVRVAAQNGTQRTQGVTTRIFTRNSS